MLKVAAGALFLTALTKTVGDAAAYLAVLAAGLAGIGYIVRKLIIPAGRAAGRVASSVEVFEELPRFMEEARLRLDLLERHVGVFAAEDAARIRQAMSSSQDVERRHDERRRPDGL